MTNNLNEEKQPDATKRVRIVGNGTHLGTKIEIADSLEIVPLVQSYTITQRVGEVARAVIEVAAPKVDLEVEAVIQTSAATSGSKIETRTYPDGTVATGFAPLPEVSPSDLSIEAEIQAKGLTAPRITPDDIEANIVGEVYFTAADAVRFGFVVSDPIETGARELKNSIIESLPTRSYAGACADIDAAIATPKALKLLTFCVLMLRNGFTVTGESACASPENFDTEIGRRLAREKAIDKVWPLMGYELRSKIAQGEA